MSWNVYLLQSNTGLTYVGATVDLDHRLRQHNGEIKGGAKATSVCPGGWIRVAHVEGFADAAAALPSKTSRTGGKRKTMKIKQNSKTMKRKQRKDSNDITDY